jgi:hypothetical protein
VEDLGILTQSPVKASKVWVLISGCTQFLVRLCLLFPPYPCQLTVSCLLQWHFPCVESYQLVFLPHCSGAFSMVSSVVLWFLSLSCPTWWFLLSPHGFLCRCVCCLLFFLQASPLIRAHVQEALRHLHCCGAPWDFSALCLWISFAHTNWCIYVLLMEPKVICHLYSLS